MARAPLGAGTLPSGGAIFRPSDIERSHGCCAHGAHGGHRRLEGTNVHRREAKGALLGGVRTSGPAPVPAGRLLAPLGPQAFVLLALNVGILATALRSLRPGQEVPGPGLRVVARPACASGVDWEKRGTTRSLRGGLGDCPLRTGG